MHMLPTKPIRSEGKDVGPANNPDRVEGLAGSARDPRAYREGIANSTPIRPTSSPFKLPKR